MALVVRVDEVLADLEPDRVVDLVGVPLGSLRLSAGDRLHGQMS